MNLTSVVARLFGRGRLPQVKARHPRRARWTSRPVVELLENRCVPAGFLVTGPTPGPNSAVQTFAANFDTGAIDVNSRQQVFPQGTGVTPAAAVAAGDLNGDGQDDTIAVVTRTPGGPPFVVLYQLNGDGSLTELQGQRFNAGFAGNPAARAWVDWADVDGAGGDELVLGLATEPNVANPGTVRIIFDRNGDGNLADNVATAAVLTPFGALAPFTAIRVAGGDLDGDGRDELAFTTAGTGSPPQVALFRNTAAGAGNFTGQLIRPLFGIPFTATNYAGGAFIAIGNIRGGNPQRGELIISQGNVNRGLGVPGGEVVILRDDGNFNYTAYARIVPTFTLATPGSVAGVNVSVGNIDNDAFDEIAVGQQRSDTTRVAVFDSTEANPTNFTPVAGSGFSAYNPTDVANPAEFNRGAFVAIATRTFEVAQNFPAAPVPIPDLATTTLSVDVPDNAGVIRDVRMFLDWTHTFFADLDVSLTFAPTGGGAPTTVELFSDLDGSSDAGPLGFRSDNLVSIANATPVTNPADTITGDYDTEVPDALNAFNGLDASGTWTLTIVDDDAVDVGTLFGFTLFFNYGMPTLEMTDAAAAPIPPLGPLTRTITVPDGGIVTNLQVLVDLDHAFIGDLEGTLTHTLADGTTVAGTVVLFDNLFGTANGYNIRLRDGAIVDLDDAGQIAGEVQGDYRPQNTTFAALLNDFVGGTWTLTINDTVAGVGGTLNSWSLRFFFD
jgi:subtilisin-like proprotein convertase family protein